LIALLALAAVLHEPVTSVVVPAFRGKPFGTYAAPNHRATLVYASDSTGGDFPESPVFVQAGGKVYALGTYRQLSKVTWAKDGKSVTFEANKLHDYGVDDVCRITYRLGAKQLDKVILRQEKDEPSG